MLIKYSIEKKIKGIMLFSITILIVECSSKSVNLKDEFGIIGNVKSINEIIISPKRNNDTIGIKNYEFDKTNRVVKMEQIAYAHEYMGNKLKTVTSGKYQYENNLIKSIRLKSITNNQTQEYIKKYFYTKGKLDSTITYYTNKDNTKSTERIEKYNYVNGKLINSVLDNNVKLIRNKDGLIEQIIIDQNTDTIFIKYELDRKGNWIEAKFYKEKELSQIIHRNINY